jgi:predicted RNA-binding protein with PUA-like domain
MNYWLVKSEPFKYAWDTFVKEGRTFWDGVRNYQARNNLREMAEGDLCLFYHSNEGKEVVGIAKVVKQAYPDPTADDPQWVCVDLVPVQPLQRPVSLEAMKKEPMLQEMGLIKQSRLSVVKLKQVEFDKIIEMSEA